MAKKQTVKTTDIRIEPHVGYKANGDEVELDQCQVFIGRSRVAYCGRRPGLPLNFIVRLSEAETSRVRAAVEQHVGEVSRTSAPSELVDASQ